jgi:hypothetical protein
MNTFQDTAASHAISTSWWDTNDDGTVNTGKLRHPAQLGFNAAGTATNPALPSLTMPNTNAGPQSYVCSAIGAHWLFIGHLLTRFPNAKVVILSTYGQGIFDKRVSIEAPPSGWPYVPLSEWHSSLQWVVNRWGSPRVKFVDIAAGLTSKYGWGTSGGYTPYIGSDGFHPSASGHECIADVLKEALLSLSW